MPMQQTNESSVAEPQLDVSEISEPVDDWSDAEDAFEVGNESDSDDEAAESHVEPEAAKEEEESPEEAFDLSKLRVPEKYKGDVQKLLSEVKKEFEEKGASTSKEEVERVKAETVQTAIETIKEVLSSPETAAEFIKENWQELGLDPRVAESYAALKQQAPQQTQQVDQRVDPSTQLAEISKKYTSRLLNAKTPEEF